MPGLGPAGGRGVVVTPHGASTATAVETLSAGGNAVDAAMAACAVQGVVAPHTCGIGGDLFALVHRPGEARPLALNASGRAGSGVDATALRAAGHTTIPRDHPAAIPVPGCVDGWAELAARLGRLSLSDVLGPAIRLADHGFPADRDLVTAVDARRAELSAHEAAAPLLGRTGALFRRPQLAATLRAVAHDGRDAFYDGPIARAITSATGGVITPDDLRRRQAGWQDPLAVDVWGRTAWTTAPNSQGYLATGACAVLERLAGQPDLDDPLTWHLAIEAYRALAAEREFLVADPDHMPVDVAGLLAAERLDAVADTVDHRRARPRPEPVSAAGGTAYLCVLDGDGLGVSLIQSNFSGFGSGIGVGSAGFLLHDRGRGFTLEPGRANELAPGKRPLHTLSPTLWTRDGRLSALLGTRGGHEQPQLLLQVAAALLGAAAGVGADPAAAEPASAQARPRWTVDVPAADLHGSHVRIEADAPDAVRAELSRLGHDVTVVAPRQPGWGPVSVISATADGTFVGAADPRVSTTTVAVC